MTTSISPSPISANNDSHMISLGLTRITRLLTALNSPHLSTPIVHIAGTNGKGSVSAYLSSILHESNLRVGRFNSPHLVDEWDSIRIEERIVDPTLFKTIKKQVEDVNRLKGFEATPFEILTATAFSLFARERNPQLDLAVIEVGMGGEGDATNVVSQDKTLLSVLTSVDLDHQGFLGDTVQEIAKVKSGIVRPHGDIVVASQRYPEVVEVAKMVAKERNARVWQARDGEYISEGTESSPRARLRLSPLAIDPPLVDADHESLQQSRSITAHLSLFGSYQLSNSSVAVLSAHLLRSLPRTRSIEPRFEKEITDESIRRGIEKTKWAGRLQWLHLSSSTSLSTSSSDPPKRRRARNTSTRVLLDGAHNPSSATLLAEYLSTLSSSSSSFSPSQSSTTTKNLKKKKPKMTLIFGLSSPRNPIEVLSPLLFSPSSSSSNSTSTSSPPSPTTSSATKTTKTSSSIPSKEEETTQRNSINLMKLICVEFSPPTGMPWVKPTPTQDLVESVSKLVREGEEGLEGRVPEVVGMKNVEEAFEEERVFETTIRGENEELDEEEEDEERIVVVAGSLYLVADALRVARSRGYEIE